MLGILLILHVFICIALILTVLMQSSKGGAGGLGGMFGGAGGGLSGAVFGGRGAATFLSKATTTLAIAFMLSCILLTFAGSGGTSIGTSQISDQAQKALEDAQVSPMELPVEQTPADVQPILPPSSDE